MNLSNNRKSRKMKTVKLHLMNTIETTFYALDGKFGRYVLKPKYRKWWRCITYGTLIILIFKYVLIPLMEIWQAVVDFIDWWRWG